MAKKRVAKIIFASIMAISLIGISFGGIFASPALAYSSVYHASANYYGSTGRLFSLGSRSVIQTSYNRWTYVPSIITTTTPAPITTPAPTPTSTPGTPSSLSISEQQAFTLLNADRVANGLSPLRLNLKLSALAGNYAQDMINRKFFAHTNPEGQSPFDRMNQAGISYGYAGENLAINVNVPAAEAAFMNSSGHRANILNVHYTQVGIGVRQSSTGSIYVVQEFIDG